MNIATQGVLLFAEIVPTKFPVQGIINESYMTVVVAHSRVYHIVSDTLCSYVVE